MSTPCLSCRKWNLETKRPEDCYVKATTNRIHTIGINGKPAAVLHALCALCSELWDMDIEFESDGGFRDSAAMYAAADFSQRNWTRNQTNMPKWGGWV